MNPSKLVVQQLKVLYNACTDSLVVGLDDVLVIGDTSRGFAEQERY